MPSVRLTYNTVLSLAVMRKQTLPRSMVVVAVPPAPALSINVVEVVARERVFPKVRPLLMVEDAWERKPPTKRLAVVEVASMVSVWRRRTWRPPERKVDVAVPVSDKPPAKMDLAPVEVASMVSVWRRRTWRPPVRAVDVAVPVSESPPAKTDFAPVEVASMVSVIMRST